jgi:hypothetical protein
VTESGRWLEARRLELARRDAGTGILVAVGAVLLTLAAGVALARAGAYRAWPVVILGAWAIVLVAAVAGVWHARRLRLRADASDVAGAIERRGGLRRGSLLGLARAPRVGSASLIAMADARLAAWLGQHGQRALADSKRERSRALAGSAVLALASAALFVVARPADPRGRDFWRPLATLARARGPVMIAVDKRSVRRGEHVAVSVDAPGRSTATLWVRAPGQSWRPTALRLDSSGHARRDVGPLDSDRYLRVTSGSRQSPTLHVRVSLPALLADLELIAHYPAYLERADEPLVTGVEEVRLPVGTVVETRGRSTLPLASATWRDGGRGIPLAVIGSGFAGRLPVTSSAEWQLAVIADGGVPIDEPAPRLNVVAVPDSAPVIAVPLPGVDTTAPLSLRQPLVIDVRDDHKVALVQLARRRVSRLGLASAPIVDTIPLPDGAAQRVVLQWTLDLNGKSYVPGDTAYYRVRAVDDAPTPHAAATREYRLRLPSTAELREALRNASQSVTARADSLLAEQRNLQQATEELAAERERASEATRATSGSRAAEGELPYRSAQRAAQIASQQQHVVEQARELTEQLKQLADAAATAGLTDPKFQAELQELERLLAQAVTPDLQHDLDALRDALKRLDAAALREALERLAQSGKDMRDHLARSRELFRRAALEGSMSTLAQDAQELAQQQRSWNQDVQGQQPDSALARAEQALARQADSLAARLAALDRSTPQNANSQSVSPEQQQARLAAQDMSSAAASAQGGRREQARRSGEQAQQRLDPIAQSLRQQRDALREQWRRDVLQSLDDALTETANLAERQLALAERMEHGDASSEMRGEQAALREGADRLLQRLQNAAGKNALVSPQVATTLGFARLRMSEVVDQLQRAMPNPTDAGQLAGQAVDGLNAMTHVLLQSRSEVQGSQSGSGLQEAIEKMAKLAAQQQALNGQASGMLPLIPLGGQGLLADLRALAERQRQLAQQLERMRAQGLTPGAEELAQEARDLARRLDAGALDRRTVERQERLFRRLLDQGRTLRGDEDDQNRKRVSKTARQDNVRLPPALTPGDLGTGPKYPYPTWDQLQRLSPEQRQLILDYFRRLNEARPR